jgi:2-phosphoglycerate kinase
VADENGDVADTCGYHAQDHRATVVAGTSPREGNHAHDTRTHQEGVALPALAPRFAWLTALAHECLGGYKPVILLAGAPGTGKSTLANLLVSRLDLDHRIGTGFIRAILQSEATEETEPMLFSMTFESEDPAARVIWQANRMRAAVAACVDRAQREGTSLVVEGSHLLPTVYHDLPVDVFVTLSAASDTEHVRRIGGHRHTQRTVSTEGINRIREIDHLFRLDAAKAGVPVLSTDAPVEEVLQTLIDLVCRHGAQPKTG